MMATIHQEMNHAIFEKWFETQLLPNIPPDSLIAMHNASHHSRRKEAMPTSSWHKGDMITWLMEKGIPYPDKNTKKILYDITCKHKDQYVVDEMAKVHGYEVVRLPPYHCELNPIQMAWSQVKQFAKKNNTTFTNTTFTIPGLQAFAEVMPTRWHDLIEHTQKKVEDHYFDADGLVRWQQVPEFVVRTDEDSSDE